MNIPNILTVLRTLMSLATAVMLCFNVGWLPTFTFFFFVAAGLTDWVDGYIARKHNMVTVFGKFMDALSDKIMVIGLFIVLLGLGLYYSWGVFAMFCALISVTREFFISGLRMMAANAGVVLAAEQIGKYKAGFQMYSIGAIICARAFKLDFGLDFGDILHDLAFYSGVATLGVSTLLSIWSGVGYAIKYGYLFKE